MQIELQFQCKNAVLTDEITLKSIESKREREVSDPIFADLSVFMMG